MLQTLRYLVPALLALTATAAHCQIAYRSHSQASAAAAPAAPTFVVGGPVAAGAGAITPSPGAGRIANDIDLLFVETANQAVSLSTPAGFSLLTSVGVGTAAGADGTRLTVFWRRWNGVAGSPTVADSGDHQIAVIVSYRGAITTGNPWDVFGTNFQTPATTAGSVSGVTTTVVNTRIVIASAGSLPDAITTGIQFSAWTNANLTGIAERVDVTRNPGNGGSIGIADGVRAVAGATGATTFTTATSATKANVKIALRPPAATLTISRPAGTVAGDVMIASITFGPCSAISGGACTTTITPPAGWTQVNTVTDQTTGAGTGGFGNRLFVYRRVATGAEPANYTWSFGGPLPHTGAAGGIISFSGVDTASPIVTQAGQTTPSATSHTAPSISTGTVTNTMLVSTHSANSSAAWTPPAGMTERVDAASLAVPNNLGLAIEMNTEPRAAAGATGTRTASWTAPPAADTGLTHMLALRPSGVNNYAISFPGGASALTCEPHQVTVTARDASNNPMNAPAGLVLNLSTNIGSGVWTTLVSGGGTWTPSGSNDGLATYTWPGGQSSFTVRLRHNTPATVNINLSDGVASEHPGADPNLTFSAAAFQVVDAANNPIAIGTQLAGKRSDTGFGAQTMFLRAAGCSALFAGQTLNVDLAAARINPTGGTGQVSILDSGGTLVAVATSAGAPPGSYTPVSLTFDAQSKAPLVFQYPDAGQVQIFARHPLPSPPAGEFVSGSSNQFVVRPFGLRVSGVTTSAAPSPSDPAAYVAGQNFNVTVTAVQWKTGDDTDANGVPDSDAQIAANAATPNFGQESTPATAALTHTLNAPSGGVAGTLGGSTTFSSFVAGTRTQQVNWSEVGFINLFASSANYLGSGQNVTNSAAGLTGVGRFRPDHFFLSAGTLTNRVASACSPASGFSYMDEGIGLAFTLQARNALATPTVTQNYTTASGYAKLDAGAIASLGLGALDGTTNLTSRLDLGLGSAGSFTAGAANVTLTTAVRRATPDNPDGPYSSVRIGVAPQDSDGVALRPSDLDMDVDGIGGNDRQQVGSDTQVRFGRLRLLNALGSERLALPVQMRLEHWNGTAFAVNTLDSCTTLPRSAIRMTDYQKNLATCETAFSSATISFSAGVASPLLTAPGAGNDGSVLLRVNLGNTVSGGTNACNPGQAADTSANRPYLRGRWNNADDDANSNTAYDDDPTARASFGLYGSQPQNFIFFRERYD